jgi:hypothetical protein
MEIYSFYEKTEYCINKKSERCGSILIQIIQNLRLTFQAFKISL